MREGLLVLVPIIGSIFAVLLVLRVTTAVCVGISESTQGNVQLDPCAFLDRADKVLSWIEYTTWALFLVVLFTYGVTWWLLLLIVFAYANLRGWFTWNSYKIF